MICANCGEQEKEVVFWRNIAPLCLECAEDAELEQAETLEERENDKHFDGG